jgi:hypothetical protein
MKKLVVMILLNFMVLHMPARQEVGIGKVAGTVIDKATKEAVFGARILLIQNGVRKGAALTGLDGSYSIDYLTPGAYSLRVYGVGYHKDSMHVEIKAGKTIRQDFQLIVDTVKTVITPCIKSNRRIANNDNISGKTLTKEEIQKAPSRIIDSIIPVKEY